MTTITQQEINRSLEPKRVDQFYVTFLELDDNHSNILGRQLKSIDRPNMTLQTSEQYNKGVPIYHHGRIEFNEISLIFIDDDSSLVNKIIYNQLVCNQMGKGNTQGFTAARFSLKIKCFNAAGKIVEEWKLKNCFFMNISHSQQVYADAETPNEITAQIRYDDIEYNFPEL